MTALDSIPAPALPPPAARPRARIDLLRQKFESPSRFLIGAELVAMRGTTMEVSPERTAGYGRDLARCPRVDWVSVSGGAGGDPKLAPEALGDPIRDAGGEVVLHLSCRDHRRDGLESKLEDLARDGFHHVLAVTGDALRTGITSGAKPAFDLDSVGLLWLLGRMNAGLGSARPGAGSPARLAAAHFYPGCVVTNFKLRENEFVPQLLKLERKLAAGARWVVNQIGYDARKASELIAWLRCRGRGSVPLIGNVFVLNPAAAEIFRRREIPGVVVSAELAALCERQGRSPDKGKAFFLEFAAKQAAVYRGLGYRGAYVGGLHSIEEFETMLDLERSFSPDDWRQFAREIRYSRPGEFFMFAEDGATGLADPGTLNPDGANGDRPRRSPLGLAAAHRIPAAVHSAMFTPGRGLWNLGVRLCSRAKDPMQGPPWLRALEYAGKAAMFGCRDCGDCSLPETAFLCPESSCAKNQRNGPCGGTRDGKCEAADRECVWARAYDRLKMEGREQDLLSHTPVLQDQGLRGTSSWANTWLGRDHRAKAAPAPRDRWTLPAPPAAALAYQSAKQ